MKCWMLDRKQGTMLDLPTLDGLHFSVEDEASKWAMAYALATIAVFQKTTKRPPPIGNVAYICVGAVSTVRSVKCVSVDADGIVLGVAAITLKDAREAIAEAERTTVPDAPPTPPKREGGDCQPVKCWMLGMREATERELPPFDGMVAEAFEKHPELDEAAKWAMAYALVTAQGHAPPIGMTAWIAVGDESVVRAVMWEIIDMKNMEIGLSVRTVTTEEAKQEMEIAKTFTAQRFGRGEGGGDA